MGSVHPPGESTGRRLIDRALIPSIDQHLDSLSNGPFVLVSESIDGMHHRGGTMTVDSQTGRRSGSRM